MAEWTGLIALASGFLMLAGLMIGLIVWLRADMNRRMDRIEVRMDRLDDRMDRIEAAVSEIRERVARLEAGQDELRERVARLETGQGELRGRMDRLETGQGGLRSRMDRLETGQGELRSRMDRIDGQLDAMPAAVGRAVAEAIGKPRTRRAWFEHPSRRTAIR